MRTEAGERDGVGADVALQVNAAQPGDVAESRQVESDDGAQDSPDPARSSRRGSRVMRRAPGRARPS